MKIVIETETPNDPRTMFRVLVDANLVGEGLTAIQAQLVAAEIIERLVLPEKSPRHRVAIGDREGWTHKASNCRLIQVSAL